MQAAAWGLLPESDATPSLSAGGSIWGWRSGLWVSQCGHESGDALRRYPLESIVVEPRCHWSVWGVVFRPTIAFFVYLYMLYLRVSHYLISFNRVL